MITHTLCLNFHIAVRRGRYTHQIKVKNIIEAKKHRAGISPYEVPIKSEASKPNNADLSSQAITHNANGSPKHGSPGSNEQLITPISVTEISSILQNNTTTVPNNSSLLNATPYTTQNNGYVQSNGIVQQSYIGSVPARVSDRLTSTGTSSSSISTSSDENGILDTDFLNYSPDAFEGFEIEVNI